MPSLTLQSNGQGVLTCSPQTNWYDGIPLHYTFSENKEEVHTVVCLSLHKVFHTENCPHFLI